MKPQKDNHSGLWQKLKEGNTDALGQLYDLFIDELFHYGLRFSQDKQTIMDAIHDMYLNLFKYRKNLADTDNVKYYLQRSLKNQILKESKIKIIFEPFDLLQESAASNKTSSFSHEKALIEKENQDQNSHRLSYALNNLSKKQKQCIFLRFTEDRQYEEIAEIMNVTVGTSRTIMYRAIKALRSSLSIFMFFYFIFL